MYCYFLISMFFALPMLPADFITVSNGWDLRGQGFLFFMIFAFGYFKWLGAQIILDRTEI